MLAMVTSVRVSANVTEPRLHNVSMTGSYTEAEHINGGTRIVCMSPLFTRPPTRTRAWRRLFSPTRGGATATPKGATRQYTSGG